MARIIYFSKDKYFNLDTQCLYVNHQIVGTPLKGIPFKIMEFLAQNSPIPMTQEKIMEKCWKEDTGAGSVPYHIMKLRKAIKDEKIPGTKKYKYIVELDGKYCCTQRIINDSTFDYLDFKNQEEHVSDNSCSLNNELQNSNSLKVNEYLIEDSDSLLEMLCSNLKQNDDEYVMPYISSFIEQLTASNTKGLNEMNYQDFLSHNINPAVYEIFLTQKIARTDDPVNFRSSFQLIHNVADCWRIFVNNNMKVVSYWVFVSLNEEAFQNFSSGEYNEKYMLLSDICFIGPPGRYKGYLLLSGAITELRSPKITNMLYDSWIKWLEELAEIGVFFSDISSIVSSPGGISSLKKIGMTQYRNYVFGGKVFHYKLSDISKINFLCKQYPNLAKKYIEEFSKNN